MSTAGTKFRKQLLDYERAGFHVVELNMGRGKGSHAKVIFAEFSTPQFLTTHINDPRAMKNNIARFKRLAAEEKTNES